MPRILFFMLMLSNSWSSSLLSNVLSEFGDFLIVIPILAFLFPSSLLWLIQLELLRLVKINEERKNKNQYSYLASMVLMSLSFSFFSLSLGLILGSRDLLFSFGSRGVINASQRLFLDFSWIFSECMIGVRFGMADMSFGLMLGFLEFFNIGLRVFTSPYSSDDPLSIVILSWSWLLPFLGLFRLVNGPEILLLDPVFLSDPHLFNSIDAIMLLLI